MQGQTDDTETNLKNKLKNTVTRGKIYISKDFFQYFEFMKIMLTLKQFKITEKARQLKMSNIKSQKTQNYTAAYHSVD